MKNDVRRLLASRSGHLHLMGVGGVGMAGLAYHLQRMGFRVSGCDQVRNSLTRWLDAQGISTQAGHDVRHVGADVIGMVRSTAVPPDHPELVAAGRAGLPVFGRGETLAALLDGHRSIAVSGTHGKTTTTACLTQLLKHAGREPSFFIGGEVEKLGGVAGVGGGQDLVVEADESDGSLVHYRPDIAVITNVDYDHMEHFRSEADFLGCFETFAGQARQRVVFGGDDAGAQRVAGKISIGCSFGLGVGAQVRASGLQSMADSSQFDLQYANEFLGTVHLPVPGRHNVLNALAACAVGLEMGLSFESMREALKSFQPVKRRFEIVAEQDGRLVVSDYAHHPTEIQALVQTARSRRPGRLLAVFQPHRYTRTLALKNDFPPAFEGVDELVLTPVYEASEKPLAGGTGVDLFAAVREAGRVPVHYAESLEEAWRHVRPRLQKGDLFLVIGAGDVDKIAAWAKAEWAKT